MKKSLKMIATAVLAIAAVAAPAIHHTPEAQAGTGCSGTAFGAPMTWGPESSARVNVMGHPGYTKSYSFEVVSNASPVVVQALGFNEKGEHLWYTIGVGAAQRASGTVPWGNRMAVPKVRVMSSNVLGATVRWWC